MAWMWGVVREGSAGGRSRGLVGLCCGMLLCWGGLGSELSAESEARLTAATREAFQRYVSDREEQMDRRLQGGASFLTLPQGPGVLERVRQGEIVIESVPHDGYDVPKAMLHDWMGTIFFPGATPAEVTGILLDYDHHRNIYPEVLESRLLSREGDHLRSFLRLKKKKVITVILNTEHEVTIQRLSESRWHIRSHSTKISEIENPGTPEEKELPPGFGQGFMWYLNAYWWLERVDGGVMAQARAISLSRDIPWAFRWIVKPFVTGIPRESLTSTLQCTRDALQAAR